MSHVSIAAGNIQAPHIEYGRLAPILIVLGAAAVGVLIEAFLGREQRYWAQVQVSLLGLVGAFAWTVALGVADNPHHVAAMGAVGVDGPTLFIQGTILALDPDIPPRNQRVRFESDGAGRDVQWRIDGKPFARGTTAQWLPWPGRHTIELADAQGQVLDTIRLEVRGAGVAAPARRR